MTENNEDKRNTSHVGIKKVLHQPLQNLQYIILPM